MHTDVPFFVYREQVRSPVVEVVNLGRLVNAPTLHSLLLYHEQ